MLASVEMIENMLSRFFFTITDVSKHQTFGIDIPYPLSIYWVSSSNRITISKHPYLGFSYSYRMKVLSIASQKGGTAKTSTSISLAAGLAKGYATENSKRQPPKVLLIDIDSQANASKVLVPDYLDFDKDDTIYRTILERQSLPIQKTTIPNLDIVLSHILLSNTDVELTTAKDHREARLHRELEKVKDLYDYILIDCPPALSWLTINAFTASDKVLVPVSPGYFELDSIVQISKTVQEVREFFNPELSLLGFLFVMSDPTINSRTSLQLLRQTYPAQVLKTIIPRNTDIRDAHFDKQDIFSYNASAKAALAYKKLIQEIFV